MIPFLQDVLIYDEYTRAQSFCIVDTCAVDTVEVMTTLEAILCMGEEQAEKIFMAHP